MAILKNKWVIVLIVVLVFVFGWLLKGCVFPSPEVKAIREKFDKFNIAAETKNNQIKQDMGQYVDNVRCFGSGACSYMIIFSFKQTPPNLEQTMKKYTKEYAQMKFDIFGFTNKLSATMSLVARTGEQTGLLCKVSGLYLNDFNVVCSNIDPREYDK